MNLINKIDNLSKALSETKKEMSEVVSKIKLERADTYFKHESQPFTNFRFAYALLSGKLLNKYSYSGDRIRLESAKNWNTKEYLNYYNIRKATKWGKFNEVTESSIFGFICYKKDLVHAIEEDLDLMWRLNVKKFKYNDSKKQFIEEFKSLSLNEQVEKYRDFISNTEYLNFVEVNNKSLGLKNIIIFEK